MFNTNFNLHQFSEAKKTFDLLNSNDIPEEDIIKIVDNINDIEAKLLILMFLNEIKGV